MPFLIHNLMSFFFPIRHSGQFGTINNFRLGRLPSVPVEWNEINAAWGQTVLLLHALANKMGLHFQRCAHTHSLTLRYIFVKHSVSAGLFSRRDSRRQREKTLVDMVLIL